MDNVFQLNDAFNFDLIQLKHPTGLQGGGYFTRLNFDDKPLYMQLNRCKTKNGIIKTNKKQYLDLLFDNTNENTISWFESLQNKCQNIIYEQRNLWFHNDLEYDDIESNFVSPLRIFKSGKYYLVRCKIPIVNSEQSTLNCYDINNNPLDKNNLNDSSQWIIPLIEVQGIRFTSRDFSFEFVVKQVMIIDSLDFNKQCMIKQQSLGNNDLVINNSLINDKELNKSPENNNLDESTENDVVKEEQHTDNVTLTEDGTTSEDLSLTEDKTVSEDLSLTEDRTASEDLSLTENRTSSEDRTASEDITASEDNTPIEQVLHTVDTSPTEESDDNTSEYNNSITSSLEDSTKNKLHTLDINFEDLGNDTVKLKNREEVYYDIWYEARNRAKLAKEEAIKAYLEAKQIKNFYMIDECSDLESDDDNEEITLEK